MIGLVGEGRALDIAYLFFIEVFDIVCYKILKEKLMKCGLDEQTVKWIKNWLHGQTQRVVISNTESSWRLSCVPQVLILGLILINFFIYDLDNEAEFILKKFADDTELGRAADRLAGHAAIQRNVVRLHKWAGNLMKINKEKYKVLHLGKNNPRRPVYARGCTVGMKLGRKGHDGPDGQQVERVPAMYLVAKKINGLD